jgi:hypothetical protein
MRAIIIFLSVCFCLMPLPSQAAAIHEAAKKGDVAAIAAALDAGVGVNESDGTATPLYYAVRRGHLAAARLLIERGADVNASSALGTPPGAGRGKRQGRVYKATARQRRKSELGCRERNCPSYCRKAWLPRLRQGSGRSGCRCQCTDIRLPKQDTPPYPPSFSGFPIWPII